MKRFVPTGDLMAEAVRDWPAMVKNPDPVFMIRVEEPFEVQTNEGVLTAPAGAYIVHDPISGHFWPCSAEYVAAHYVPAARLEL